MQIDTYKILFYFCDIPSSSAARREIAMCERLTLDLHPLWILKPKSHPMNQALHVRHAVGRETAAHQRVDAEGRDETLHPLAPSGRERVDMNESRHRRHI